MQINANLCTEGSGSAWGGFDWQLQVCVCWGAMLGSGCFCVVGHGCLSMFYMLWIHWLHTSVASPLHRTGPREQRGLPSKKLSTHQELSSASLSSSRAGSSQGIIIKSMPQLHRAWLCAEEQEGQRSGLVCVDSRECLWEEEVPMWCSPRSLMGWERGSRSEPPITSGGKLAKWIGTCSLLPPTGNVNAICFCGKVLSCRTVLHLDNVNINSWKQWCQSNWVVVIYHFWHFSPLFFICKAGGSKTNLAGHGWSHYSVYYSFTQTPRPIGKHLEITDIK